MIINRDRIETRVAGILCVTIGTAIAATSVSAQNKSVQPAGGPASCAPVETPDAMCSIPLKRGPETRICFGDHHPRCFEMKAAQLLQTLNGGLVQNLTLSTEQQASVKTSITSYAAWLEKELGPKSKQGPNRYNACSNTVSIDSMSEHKVFCLTRLPAKEVDAKTKELLALLEMPVKSKRSSAL